MSSGRSEPVMSQPTLSNPLLTQPGATAYHEKTPVAPGASMHGEALPQHSMLRTRLRQLRDNTMFYGRQYLPLLGTLAALMFLVTLAGTMVPMMYNMLPGMSSQQYGSYGYNQPMYSGPGMTGQLLQRGQQAAHELYETLPSTGDVSQGLERGMEKGIDYLRDLRGNYDYGYNMGMGQTGMMGGRQGLMSSMIWPWNWFSSSYQTPSYGMGAMGGRGMMGQRMMPYQQKSMLNPINWSIWPWNWSIFSSSRSYGGMGMMGGRGMMGQQMYPYQQKSMLNPINWTIWPWNWSIFGSTSGYNYGQVSEDAVWQAIERVADELKRDARQHHQHV